MHLLCSAKNPKSAIGVSAAPPPPPPAAAADATPCPHCTASASTPLPLTAAAGSSPSGRPRGRPRKLPEELPSLDAAAIAAMNSGTAPEPVPAASAPSDPPTPPIFALILGATILAFLAKADLKMLFTSVFWKTTVLDKTGEKFLEWAYPELYKIILAMAVALYAAVQAAGKLPGIAREIAVDKDTEGPQDQAMTADSSLHPVSVRQVTKVATFYAQREALLQAHATERALVDQKYHTERARLEKELDVALAKLLYARLSTLT